MTDATNRDDLSRRAFVRKTTATAAAMAVTSLAADAKLGSTAHAQADASAAPAPRHPFLTAADDFTTVARGNPRPHTLEGEAQKQARLAADTWRLEITVDPFVEPPHVRQPATAEKQLTIADGTALDLPALMDLGRKHGVKFIKAMQCLNIETPLGQGLWEGVPLRDVLALCGKLSNVRRIYYWGFHNNDPGQLFQSSLSYTQVMETPPDELPVFLAYRLNSEPLPPVRGGPVRMLVPWSHGFKSIKWLHHIFLTNDYRPNDTYALSNNDPESYLKTAAYVDGGPATVKAGEPVHLTGQVICGRSGLKHVEYWVRAVDKDAPSLADDDPVLLRGPWVKCDVDGPPDWKSVLPAGVSSRDILGFDPLTGQPLTWPLRYGMTMFRAVIADLPRGKYEIRARSVDLNGFAQPEPRPIQKSGKNAIQMRRVEIV